MKSKIVLIPLIVIVVLVLLVVSGVFYTVYEGETGRHYRVRSSHWTTDCHCWVESKNTLYSAGPPL